MSQDLNYLMYGRVSPRDEDLLRIQSNTRALPGMATLLEEVQFLRDAYDGAVEVLNEDLDERTQEVDKWASDVRDKEDAVTLREKALRDAANAVEYLRNA